MEGKCRTNRQLDTDKRIHKRTDRQGQVHMLIDKQKKQYAETEGWTDWINKHKGETSRQIDRLGDECMDRKTK